VFLEMIERYFPTLRKLELNRRGPARKGWDAWGDEAVPAGPTRYNGCYRARRFHRSAD